MPIVLEESLTPPSLHGRIERFRSDRVRMRPMIILILVDRELRDLLDIRVFVGTEGQGPKHLSAPGARPVEVER